MKNRDPDFEPSHCNWLISVREPCLLLEKSHGVNTLTHETHQDENKTRRASSVIKLDNCHVPIHRLENICQDTMKFSKSKRTPRLDQHKEYGFRQSKGEMVNTTFTKSQGTERRKPGWPHTFSVTFKDQKTVKQHLENLEGKQLWLKNPCR